MAPTSGESSKRQKSSQHPTHPADKGGNSTTRASGLVSDTAATSSSQAQPDRQVSFDDVESRGPARPSAVTFQQTHVASVTPATPASPGQGAPPSRDGPVGQRMSGQGVQNCGTFSVGGNLHIGSSSEERLKDERCLAELCATDPRNDKKRIQQTKGGLLTDSYGWILENQTFKTWRDDHLGRLLWVKGNPGKGKTMLLCGIIDELEKSAAGNSLLSYFFCQGTDSQINNATAVLRGLIYLLVEQQPSLISHVRKKYGPDGTPLFREVNAWVALSEIFEGILRDSSLKDTYLIIDALDECETGLLLLLEFIVCNSSTSPRVKWIVSSRNRPEIEQHLKLDDSGMKLCLELTENAGHVAQAVSAYIDFKVRKVHSLQDDDEERNLVREIMYQKANGTFLWVALVIKELEKPDCLDPLHVVREVPASLYGLYERILDQIWRLEGALRFCQLILPVVTLAYRPLSLAELSVVSGQEIPINKVRKVVEFCGSFLTVQKSYIYFVHQSVKDYLSGKASSAIFPLGAYQVHYSIYSRSIQALSGGPLRRNTYDLPYPGQPIDNVLRPDPDPLAAVRYSCIHWISHLCESIANSSDAKHQHELDDNGRVSDFLRAHFLHWLEASSLLRAMSDAILSVTRLESLLRVQSPQSQLLRLAHDAYRFALHNTYVIENAPLQAYLSALIFSPTQSLIRNVFSHEEPSWMSTKPVVESTWSPCLQTLKGHSDFITSMAFSSDSKLAASGSCDNTIKIWDATTGRELHTLKGHSDWVKSVALSSNLKLVASGSDDNTIKIWDATTGCEMRTLEGHSDWVTSVAFSGDSKFVASGSCDNTIKIWDAATGAEIRTLKGHSDWVSSVAVSSNSKLVASGSDDSTIKISDVATGCEVRTLKDHGNQVASVAFSSNSRLLASGSDDNTITIWNVATGHEAQTLDIGTTIG